VTRVKYDAAPTDRTRLLGGGRDIQEDLMRVRLLTVIWSVVIMLIPAMTTAQTVPRLSPALRVDTIPDIVERRSPSIVFIHTLGGTTGTATREEGLGSGVVVDAAGLIVTNAHVVEGTEVVHVRMPSGLDRTAHVVGVDRTLDLALLRVANAVGLRAAPLGDSGRLRIGEFVVAIGNPYGLHHTVSLGIVSAKARALPVGGPEMLQTDAAISPGSSGGALFDLRGRVVGITTLMFTGTSSGNIGLNFAIPINVVKAALPKLGAAGASPGPGR